MNPPTVIIIGADDEEHDRVCAGWHSFDARCCECFAQKDKERILAIIQCYPGGVQDFNDHVKKLAGALLKKVRVSIIMSGDVTMLATSSGDATSAGAQQADVTLADESDEPIVVDAVQLDGSPQSSPQWSPREDDDLLAVESAAAAFPPSLPENSPTKRTRKQRKLRSHPSQSEQAPQRMPKSTTVGAQTIGHSNLKQQLKAITKPV